MAAVMQACDSSAWALMVGERSCSMWGSQTEKWRSNRELGASIISTPLWRSSCEPPVEKGCLLWQPLKFVCTSCHTLLPPSPHQFLEASARDRKSKCTNSGPGPWGRAVKETSLAEQTYRMEASEEQREAGIASRTPWWMTLASFLPFLFLLPILSKVSLISFIYLYFSFLSLSSFLF